MNARPSGRGLGGSVWIVLAIAHLAAGCAPQATTPSDVIRPVKTSVVTAGEEAHVRSFPGRVEASKRVELAFQVSGLLVKLPVKEGQRVAKGEVIAELRQDEFQARLKSLRAQLVQAQVALRALRAGERLEQRLRLEAQVRAAQARLANARAEFDRTARLVRSGAVAREEHERAETTYRVAQEEYKAAQHMLEKGTIAREEDIEAQEAAVRGLEARVVEANLQLADSTLHAPYDGVIAQRFVEQNQNVTAKQPIVKFQDVDEIDIITDIPETVMAAIRSADIVETLVDFSGAPGVQFPVHVREMGQRADPTTQTFQVRVAMKAPPDANILPGMSANVTLTYRRASILGSRILVPFAAVYKDSMGEQVVWVLGPDKTVSRRPVKLGEASGGRLEIVDGLRPGDRIAVAGVTHLREGMKIRDLGDALGGSPP